MLERIESLMKRRTTFAIETTLATRSYKQLVLKAKENGYKVVLLFFWLPSPQQAEQRVALRVASGGHNIPKEVIPRRYWNGIRNLFEIFIDIVDSWLLYDNTDDICPIVENGEIIDRMLFNQIIKSCQKKIK